MIGAIIGDIAGSRFEFRNHKSKDFELFDDGCFVTDDSIMTLSVAKAIMETRKEYPDPDEDEEGYYRSVSRHAIHFMREIGQRYPSCGYGMKFFAWIFSKNPEPYNSFGNGAAMRISPVGFTARSEREVIRLSRAVTGVTHNHPEGIKGAEAVAMIVYLARNRTSKEEIRGRINQHYYPLSFTIPQIRPTYRFDVSCQGSVPQALEAFLESESFEDCIRIAVSLGGDSDTIAAIAGGIAEAYYGVPDQIKNKALNYLDRDLLKIYREWEAFMESDRINQEART